MANRSSTPQNLAIHYQTIVVLKVKKDLLFANSAAPPMEGIQSFQNDNCA